MVRTLKVSVERKTFLVNFEGESGGKWCSLTEHNRGSVSTLGFEKEEVCFNNHGRFIRLSEFASNRKSTFLVIPEGEKGRGWEKSFANVIREEGSRRGGLVPVGRWARAVVCECTADCDNWVEVGHALARRLGQKGVVTIVPFLGRKVEKGPPRENSEVVGKFRGGWIKLRGLPFHLWSEEHLKKIVEQWGTVTEIDWQMLKLFDLCKARVRILMKERSVLSTLIEVLDGGWVFTISVAMVGVEEVRRGREMGESTREDFVPHSWKCGGRQVERDRSTTDGSSSVRAVGKMKKGEKRLGSAGLEQVGEAWAEGDKAYSNDEEGHRASNSKQERRAQSPLNPSPLWSELKKLGEVEKWVSQPREDFVPHSWTCGGRWVERDRSTTDGSSSVGQLAK
ncbi:hypothetical protein CK203_111686 [Vitis vinifera]|uniref:Uncharacterized protein n=1 Tax=Vitis vinifera TaxID=29760 RepID=A0A438FCL8_VITVI|nr:hypothetical protein CK203_111686 [Vitis vinifera]